MELLKPTGFRKIIDADSIFQMLIPPTWRYWVIEGRVHNFEGNENEENDDCFQLSVMHLSEAERNKLAEALGY